MRKTVILFGSILCVLSFIFSCNHPDTSKVDALLDSLRNDSIKKIKIIKKNNMKSEYLYAKMKRDYDEKKLKESHWIILIF